MNEQRTIEACLQGCSAENVIHDVLVQAERREHLACVAQCLVGAKLELRFNREISVCLTNKSVRSSLTDMDAKFGDFEIANAVIKVAVGLPDEEHIEKIGELVRISDVEVWILTSADRVSTWKHELEIACGTDGERIVVTSVEKFVGQTITELANFSTKGKAIQLEALFARYNSRWVRQVGTPGIQIIIK